jgi:hypothetical protein
MARIRTIKPEFWSDVKIARLTPLARLLYIAIFNFADDYGRGRYSPKEIAAFAFPEDDDLDARPLLQELIDSGRIHLYLDADQRFFHVPNFAKHQYIKDKAKPRLPDPDGLCSFCCNDSRISGDSPRISAENPPREQRNRGTEEQGNRGTGEARECAPLGHEASSSTTTDHDAVLEADFVVAIPKAPPSPKLVSAAAALDRRLSAPRLAQAWQFTADQQALINQAGEAIGVPGDELAGKVGQSLAKAPMGQDDDGTYDAWFALDAGTVAQWLEAAVAIALRSANKSLPYVVGVVRSRLKSGTTAPPGTVVQFAQPSQPAVVPAPVPPELAERPWWAALVKVAKNPIAPSVIDVMNLAHALGLSDQDEAAAIKLQAEGAVAACDWLWALQPAQKVG